MPNNQKYVDYLSSKNMTQEENRSDKSNKDDWRSVMLAQYNIFGVMAGLEVTALTIFSRSDDLTLQAKWIFIATIISLFLQVIFTLFLINAEREVASGNKRYLGDCNFQGKEKIYRWVLIVTTAIVWILISTLLVISILE